MTIGQSGLGKAACAILAAMAWVAMARVMRNKKINAVGWVTILCSVGVILSVAYMAISAIPGE